MWRGEDLLLRIRRSSAWLGLSLFAVGATLSISLEEAGAVLLMFSAVLALLTGAWQRRRFAAALFVLLYVAGYLVSSLLVSRDVARSLRLTAHHLWKIPFFFAVVGTVSWREVERTLRLLLGVAAVAAAYGILQFLTGVQLWKRVYLHPAGPFYQAIGFAGLHLTYGGLMSMVSLVAAAMALDSRRESGMSGLMLGAVAVLSALATLASLSRSAMVGLLGGWVFFVALALRRRWKAVLGLTLLVVVAVLAVPVVRERLVAVAKVAEDPRAEAWGTAWNALRRSPVLGLGPGMYERRYDEFRSGTKWWVHGHPHNDILGAWLDGGLLSLVGYLGFMIGFVLYGLRGHRRTGEHLPLGLGASVVTMFFQGLSQCYFATAMNLWLFWFFAAALVSYGWEHGADLTLTLWRK